MTGDAGEATAAVRRWSDTTKLLVVIAGVILAGMIVVRLRFLMSPFVVALLLAYVLNPLVGFLQRKTRLPRTLIAALIYLGLIIAVLLTPIFFVPSLIEEVRAINIDFQAVVDSIVRTVEGIVSSYSAIDFFGYTFNVPLDTSQFRGELERNLSSLAGRSANILIGFASSFASGLLWLVLILVASFYLLRDADRIRDYFYRLMPPDYRDELWALGGEIGHIWNDFLRGQLVLCTVIGAAVGLALWVVGLRNALILGILAGVLEIIPNLGPALSSVPAILIALLQGSTRLEMSNLWFALLVAGLYIFIQQVENNYLVPRIIGRSVNLPPVVVLLGVVAGASLAGILGIFLAAPTMATVRVLARYAYNKVLDVEVEAVRPTVEEPSDRGIEPEQPVQQAAQAAQAPSLDKMSCS